MKRYLALALGTAVFAGACADPTSHDGLGWAEGLGSAHTGPVGTLTFFEGNISGTAADVCSNSNVNPNGEAWFGFKVDSNDDTNQATIEVTITDGKFLAWASSGATVRAVVVKGGQDTNIYSYDGTVDHDNNLVSPVSGGGGTPNVSHYVVCYTANLKVEKTANTTYDRTFDWTLAKSADVSSLVLSPTQTGNISYEVVVTKGAAQDFGHTVYGEIKVSNPFDFPIEVADVQDSMFDAELECPALPATLAPGASLTCTYSVAHASNGSNTATAISGTNGIGNGSATANFAFGAPANVSDDCVNLSDTMPGTTVTGTICGSQTFNYGIVVGPYGLPCGLHEVVNIARAIESDSGTERADTVEIEVEVAGPECTPEYCTLTQGYWRNHGDPATRRYDAGWELVGGTGAAFFATGKTWLEVFNTPVKGAAGVSLAHQYMAAKLNVLNADGAAFPQEVLDALAGAEAWFAGKTWNQVSAKQPKNVHDLLNGWAKTLDDFNNGVIGAGHCS